MAANSLADFSNAVSALVERTARSIVSVHGRDRAPSSGIVFRPGLVVTAEEALDRDDDIELTLPGGKRVPATLVGRDPSTDIALLRVEGSAPAAEWTAAAPVAAGAFVLAVGRADDATLAAFGVVSELGASWKSMRGGVIDRRIRLGLRLEGRAEGGAVIDAAGGIVGLAVLGPRRRPLVIPIETVNRVVDQLSAKGYIARGYLGVGLHPLRATAAGEGAIAVSIDDDGPAKAAGALLGDVFKTWNGEPIHGVEDIFARLTPDSVGKTVALGILRAGQAAALNVRVGERPRS